MARGRYAASAAKRRAESAEEQLDRLLPQLVDAQRQAKRYKSEAEAAVTLRRQLANVKERNGIPVEDHLAALRNGEQQMEEVLAAYDDAVQKVLDTLVNTGVIVEDPEAVAYISSNLLMALHIIPRHVTAKLLTKLGWDRWARREWPSPEAADRLIEMASGKPSQYGHLTELGEDLGRAYAKYRSAKINERRGTTADDDDT